MHSNRGFLGALHSLQEWYLYLTLNKFIIFATRNLKVRHLDNVVVAGYSFSLTTKKFNGTLCMGTRFWYGKFPGNYDDVFCVRACLSWRDPRSKFESESKLWEIIGNDLEKTLNFMSVWALLIWSLRVDIVIFTRKRKERTYHRDYFSRWEHISFA